jgi:transcriptional regulator with PAS, ATPase and Fis domain
LPERLQVAWQHAKYMRPPEEKIELDSLLTSLEKEIIQRAMRQARNNKSKAASLLGISRPRLMRRLEQLEIVVSQDNLEETIDFQPLEETESSDS